MSHLRDTTLLAELSKDSSSPSSLQEPFLIEELPREMQCQFILKPSRLTETQQLSGELLLLLHRALILAEVFIPGNRVNPKAKTQTCSQRHMFSLEFAKHSERKDGVLEESFINQQQM